MKAMVLTLGAVVTAAMAAAELPVDDLVAGMVRIDRACIPALALTKEGRTVPSEKALRRLQKEWRTFAQRHADAAPDDAQWTTDFDAITGLIQRVDASIVLEDLTKAHADLEQVQDMLMALRARHGIPYYLDGLTRFHGAMESLLAAAGGDDGVALRAALDAAKARWAEALEAPFDPTVFRFSEERAAKRAELAAEVTAALDAVDQATVNGGPAQVQAAAQALQSHFAELYKLFGTFTGL